MSTDVVDEAAALSGAANELIAIAQRYPKARMERVLGGRYVPVIEPDMLADGQVPDGVEVFASKDDGAWICPYVIVATPKGYLAKKRRVYIQVGHFGLGYPTTALENLTRTPRGRAAVAELLACMAEAK